ncbi:S-adenosyl-L-methionine-dependent methyltransferase [Aureobasidium pullulans]|nr:S-adenosyl-L-methionine-dependent methyltransferase [Aureobasidium pullulans]
MSHSPINMAASVPAHQSAHQSARSRPSPPPLDRRALSNDSRRNDGPAPPTPHYDQPTAAQQSEAFQQALNTIEVQGSSDDDSYSDSGYEESINSAFLSTSTSMTSSVRHYDFENGRRYHAYRQGHYLLPNDDAEQEREDIKHATVLIVCGGKLHFAPVPQNASDTRILDIGTGTGIWCVEMGDHYPSAQITGVDLSPIQPDWVPPNVNFIVDDIASEWLYPENHFDMIHARHMGVAIKDWDHVLASAYTHLKPGAWLEFCEFDYWPSCDDGTMTEDNLHFKWHVLVTEGMIKAGVDLHAALTLKDRITKAGFKNVTERIMKVPLGSWAKNPLLKKVGSYMHAVLYDGLQGICMGPLTRGLGWSRDQVELYLPGVRKDLNNMSVHTYYSLHVITAQKPYN